MDPKELKSLLKEAKEALKSKDFNTTTKNCKAILKKEPNHYQANLYLGTSMKEQSKWQQALESYKKATEIDPKQIYAWQGLVLVYEMQGIKSGHKDLLDAYKQVANFFENDDKQKYIESTKKLANALISQQEIKSALKVVSKLAKSVDVDLELAGMITQLLVSTKYDTRTENENELYTQALEALVTDAPQPTEDICKRYFTQLNRTGDFEGVIKQGLAMKERWNTYIAPMEWLCRYYIEGRLKPDVLQKVGPIDVLTEKLFKLHPSSSFGHTARGKFLIDGGLKMGDGFVYIRTALESNYNPYAVQILVRGRVEFGDFEGALEDCQAGLRSLGKERAVFRNLQLLSLEANIGLNCNQGKALLDKIKEDKSSYEGLLPEILIIEAQLCVKMLEFDSLREVIKEIDKNNLLSWKVDFYRVLAGLDFQDPQALQEAIDGQLMLGAYSVDLLFEIAVLLFNFKQYEKSGKILLQATELPKGSARPLPWKYLGLLYSLQDNCRLAAKCFKKSYELCQSAEVGALLSDTYFEIGEPAWNLQLLNEATKAFGKARSKWAWLRLGILHLNGGDANEAVNAFQAAIRADINDCHVWESLADAYFLRGSYTAALNSYNKALSLGVDSMYPKLKIGVVYQCLGQHEDSTLALESLLKEYPGNTPILTELARTFSLTAQDMTKENFDISAQRAVENSLHYAVLALKNSPTGLILPWLIIGDSPLILQNISMDSKIKVPDYLLGEVQENYENQNVRTKKVDIDKFREIGTRALLECLELINSEEKDRYSRPLLAYVYHQLALSYFNRAVSMTGEKRNSELLKRALISVKKAVVSQAGNHTYWNTLGVIAFFSGIEELAQHSFIKSLELEGNNVVAWCNLGILYLKHKNERLAHQAFTKAQSVAPLYSSSWVGQGLVAEVLAPTEAADLFRHAAHLDTTPFAVCCYADWICRLYLKTVEYTKDEYWFSVQRVDAFTIVNDLMTKVEQRYQNIHLYNLKGIISAANGFYDTAIESFSTALQLKSKNGLSTEDMAKIFLNRITVLVKAGRYEEAKHELSSIEDLDSIGLFNAALVLTKLGDLQSASGLYSNLLQHPETNSKDVADVRIALGMLANKTGGYAAACSWLSDQSLMQNPQALLAISAIAVSNFDVDLSNNVINMLGKLSSTEDYLADIGLMKGCLEIMKENPRKGVNELLKLIRVHPLNGILWSMASQMLYRYQWGITPTAVCRNVTLIALKLSSLKGKSVTDTEYSIISKSSAMISLCYLVESDWKSAIITALTGIRRFPKQRENWVVLACGLWFQFTEERTAKVYDQVVRLLQKEVLLNQVSEQAILWIANFLEYVKQYKQFAR